MNRLMFLAVIMLSFTACNGQRSPLKSLDHGFTVMLTDVPKEEIIEEIRFDDGQDRSVDVIRLDHVGPSLYPLIISSKIAVPTDSLGLLSFRMHEDSLRRFLRTIDTVNPKVYERRVDNVLIRVTYRLKGKVFQYYVTNAIITTEFLKLIEERLVANGDPDGIEKFYDFIGKTGLRRGVNGEIKWVYDLPAR